MPTARPPTAATNGFWLLRQRIEKIEGMRAQAAALRRFEKLADIGAGAERAWPPASTTQRIASFASGLAQRAGHRGIHRLGQRVLLLRAVHPDDANGAVVGDDDQNRTWDRPLFARPAGSRDVSLAKPGIMAGHYYMARGGR